MEHLVTNYRELKRHINSIEHMIYVSCKFTRTTEMLRRVMETVVQGYELFFGVAYEVFSQGYDNTNHNVHDKIQILKDGFMGRGMEVDLSDYFLLKRLLMSDFENIGEYRKNLCMVSYVDGEEYVINMAKLLDFFTQLKTICNGLSSVDDTL